eukprot:4645367-Prymnesium_polylepis.1
MRPSTPAASADRASCSAMRISDSNTSTLTHMYPSSPAACRRSISAGSSSSPKLVARARALRPAAQPKYTASAPALIAASTCGHPPAGASSTGRVTGAGGLASPARSSSSSLYSSVNLRYRASPPCLDCESATATRGGAREDDWARETNGTRGREPCCSECASKMPVSSRTTVGTPLSSMARSQSVEDGEVSIVVSCPLPSLSSLNDTSPRQKKRDANCDAAARDGRLHLVLRRRRGHRVRPLLGQGDRIPRPRRPRPRDNARAQRVRWPAVQAVWHLQGAPPAAG